MVKIFDIVFIFPASSEHEFAFTSIWIIPADVGVTVEVKEVPEPLNASKVQFVIEKSAVVNEFISSLNSMVIGKDEAFVGLLSEEEIVGNGEILS